MKRHLSIPTTLRRTLAFLGAITLAATASAQTPLPAFTNLWSLSSGTNAPDLPNDLPAAGNFVRGIAINPVTTNVLYASTTAGTNNGNNHITVLDAANNGAYLAQLNASGVSGGTLNLAPVRVAEDGAIYSCNVVLATGTLLVYRWVSDADVTTPATVIFTLPGVATRYGDNLDVRGSGLDTEVLITGNGGNGFLILKPAEPTLTTWTNVTLTFPGGVSMAARGVAFDGASKAFYGKPAGSAVVFRVAYDLAVPTNYVTATFALDQTATAGIDFAEVAGVRLLSAIVYSTSAITNGAAHRARVYQLTSASNAVSVLDRDLPFPNQANGNGLGMTDIQKGRLVFGEPNNGIAFYALSFVTNLPPTISAGAQPAGATVVQSFSYTFTVSPSGTAPLAYQWYFNRTNLIPGATASTLPLSNLQLAAAGGYSVVVTNPYGSVTSVVANLNVLPGNFSSVASPIWTLAPGSRDYLTTDNTQRGLTYDRVTGRLVLLSRAPTNGVHLLNATTGADVGEMDLSGLIAAGTFPLNLAAAADDGAVFACNLLASATTDSFIIYRWLSANVYPDDPNAYQNPVYSGNPGLGRLGDTFAARGAGLGTELLAAVRTGTNVVLFTTADGYNWSPNILAVTNLPADAQANGFAGLGLAFGPTNTFWAKSSGFMLRLVRYDLASLTAEVIADYAAAAGTMAPIGVDNANSLLAGIGVGEIPQNLQFWDVAVPGAAQLVDREVFPTSNANGNGTGAVAFDVNGGRVFALDTNNGLLAAKYAPALRYTSVGGSLLLSWAGPAKLQHASVVTGPYTAVSGATSPYVVPAGGPHFYRLTH
jgi:hypothetical protein